MNISVGKSGDVLERAARILEGIVDQKPVLRKAKVTVKDFGIRKGEPIACSVTLRRQHALEFLKRALAVVANKIPVNSFDNNGNFSFGIKEHIEIPNTKYDPELGIVGMDVAVTLTKPGYRVVRRSRAPSKISRRHRVSCEEAIAYVKEHLRVEIVGETSSET